MSSASASSTPSWTPEMRSAALAALGLCSGASGCAGRPGVSVVGPEPLGPRGPGGGRRAGPQRCAAAARSRCDRSLVVRITPDEVPYPEPAMAVPAPPAPRYHVGLEPRLIGDLIDRSSLTARCRCRICARGDPGRVGLSEPRPFAERGDGADAADARRPRRRYSVRHPFDPAANVEAGTRHLRIAARPFSARSGAGRLQRRRRGGRAVSAAFPPSRKPATTSHAFCKLLGGRGQSHVVVPSQLFAAVGGLSSCRQPRTRPGVSGAPGAGPVVANHILV